MPRLFRGKLVRSKCVRVVVKCLKVLNTYRVWDREAYYLTEPARGLYPYSLWNRVRLMHHVGKSTASVQCHSGTVGHCIQGKWALDTCRGSIETLDICQSGVVRICQPSV